MERCSQSKYPIPINTSTTPLLAKYYHIHPLKYHPQQCVYMDGSFIPPTENAKGQIEGNTIGLGVYNPNNNIRKTKRLPGYQKILCIKLNGILYAIKTIQTTQLDMHIFTYNLNSIYLINNHIHHPTSPPPPPPPCQTTNNNYRTLDILAPHTVHTHKVHAHSCIIGNEIANTLPNEGTLIEKSIATPYTHMAHTTSY